MSAFSFNNLKMFKTPPYTLQDLATSIPEMVITSFCMFLVVTPDNKWTSLYPNTKKLFQYYIDFGVAIRDSNYVNFANIIIPFLEECYSYQYGKICPLVFDIEAKEKFVDICNGFKGNSWNDISNIFFDELLILGRAGSINGKYLYGDQ